MTLDINNAPKSTKKDKGRIPDGTHPARIVSVIDIGIQHQTDWQSQKPQYHVLDEDGSWAKNGNELLFTTEPNDAPDLKPQIMITFEFPTERIEIEKDGETESLPRWQTKEYTFSTHEKSGLMQLLTAIAPGVTKLGELVDKPCLVAIGTTSGGNPKITGVTAMVKGMEVAPLENETVVFSFDDSTAEDYNSLKDWIKKKISQAENFNKEKFFNPETEEDFGDEDIPF